MDAVAAATHSISKFGLWKTVPDLGSFNWSLAANTGAFSEPHVDAGGFCTYVNIICGTKVWYVAVAHPIPDEDGWDKCVAEATWIPILLKPGDQL